MTGHEIGVALGVANLSAAARSAGWLVTAAGATDAFSAGFIGAAAVVGAVLAVFALRRMPATRVAGGGGHMHMHWAAHFSCSTSWSSTPPTTWTTVNTVHHA